MPLTNDNIVSSVDSVHTSAISALGVSLRSAKNGVPSIVSFRSAASFAIHSAMPSSWRNSSVVFAASFSKVRDKPRCRYERASRRSRISAGSKSVFGKIWPSGVNVMLVPVPRAALPLLSLLDGAPREKDCSQW